MPMPTHTKNFKFKSVNLPVIDIFAYPLSDSRMAILFDFSLQDRSSQVDLVGKFPCILKVAGSIFDFLVKRLDWLLSVCSLHFSTEG